MKLQIIDFKRVGHRKGNPILEPIVRISKNTTRMAFNQKAIEMLAVSESSAVMFGMTEDGYCCIFKDDNGIKFKKQQKSSNQEAVLVITNAAIVYVLRKNYSCSEKESMKFLIGEKIEDGDGTFFKLIKLVLP
jgi:hypothetical protein